MDQMERRTPRFPVSASAELIWGDSIELTRVTELSRYGCYLETSRPLPPGTRVTVKVMDRGQLFEATATVLYSRPPLGMGVAFREVKSIFQTILEHWLQQSLERQSRTPTIDNFETE
jgi:PilZ domain